MPTTFESLVNSSSGKTQLHLVAPSHRLRALLIQVVVKLSSALNVLSASLRALLIQVVVKH